MNQRQYEKNRSLRHLFSTMVQQNRNDHGGRGRIEDALIVKNNHARARIDMLRMEKQAKELAEMKASPDINPVSRKIAERGYKNSLTLMSSPNQSVQQSLAGSPGKRNGRPPLAMQTPEPLQVHVSMQQLHDGVERPGQMKQAGYFSNDYTPETNQNKLSALISKFKGRKNQQEQDMGRIHALTPQNRGEKRVQFRKQSSQNAYNLMEINRLRQAALARFPNAEPEEPPDLLNMDVIQRNHFWLKRREEKVKQRVEEKKDRELDGCTFSPRLRLSKRGRSTSLSSSALSNRSTTKERSLSYKSLYLRKRNFRNHSLMRIDV